MFIFLIVLLMLIFEAPKTIALPRNVCGSVSIKASFCTNNDVPQNPCVPVLSYDDTSITLAWNKPDNYTDVGEYNVYMNGKKLGSASGNNAVNSVAYAYINNFFEEDKAGFHNKITWHSFKATDLLPNTAYTFHVTSVHSSGKESAPSVSLVQHTARPFANVFDVASLGAVGDAYALNTKVIQKAIDDCSSSSTTAYGCKVLIPAGGANVSTYVTGSLFLKSNITFEIEEGAVLLGSNCSSDYPLYSTGDATTRAYALLNTDWDNTYSNIRITGKGSLDGNGWKKVSDITDEVGNKLPHYVHGSSSTWQTSGVLAKSQLQAAVDRVGGNATSSQISNFYSNIRSSLASFFGVENIFFGNLKLLNPAFHGITFNECNNIAIANTLSQTYDVNNGDGIELNSSTNALVYNNFMDNGDDCINFAAGQGKDGENMKPDQFTWIFNNYIRQGHGGVVVGSHTAAFVQDILAEDNVMFLTDNGFRLKSTPATGGGSRRLVFRDTAMREVGTNHTVISGGRTFEKSSKGSPIIVTLAYKAGSTGFTMADQCAQFSNISIKRVSVNNGSPQTGGAVISVDGYNGEDSTLSYPKTFHKNLVFDTLKFTNIKPVNISQLSSSVFNNINITNFGNSSTPWIIRDSEKLVFTHVVPAPN